MIENLFIAPNLSQDVCAEQVNVRRSAGFTLLELMIVMVILGIMATFATTSYNSVREKARAESAAGELKAILTSARLSALSRGQSVQITINYDSGAAAVKNSITASHMGGTYDAVTEKVTGNERNQEAVYWFRASTASNNCQKATATKDFKTIEFSPRATVTDISDGGTPSVMVSSDVADTKDLHCIQVRPVTGRVAVIKP